MEDPELFAKIVGHIEEFLEVDVSHLKTESKLASALPGLDSLKLYEMFLYLEDCFEVSFDETVIDRMESMGDLVGYIQGQLKSNLN